MAKFNFKSIFVNICANKPANKKIKKPNIKISNVGEFIFDPEIEWYYGPKIILELPNTTKIELCLVLVDDSAEQGNSIYEAIEYFKNNSIETFRNAEKHIFEYYKTTREMYGIGVPSPIIKNEKEVWNNIRFGNDAFINYRNEDRKIYISFECECTWEKEHGLQIVIKEGKLVNKIGQFDGHLTNSDAFDKSELENIVYFS